jgi:hypothetical protein
MLFLGGVAQDMRDVGMSWDFDGALAKSTRF